MTDIDCAFCKIVKAPWVTRHNNGIVSFKPFGAVNEGHRMFVPIVHAEGADTAPDLTGQAFATAAVHAAEKGVPFNLVVNSGAEADQTVFHLHVHYVPREVGDNLGYRWRVE